MTPDVEVFDLDAAGAEFGHLGTDVADLPCRLGLLAGGPDGAVGHVQARAAAAPSTMAFPSSFMICSPGLPWLELPGCGEVGGQQARGDRVLSEHGMSLLLPGPWWAQAGWMLALWWNRFWGSYSALIVASRWYLAGP